MSDSETDSEARECDIVGCFNEFERHCSFCHEKVCDEHSTNDCVFGCYDGVGVCCVCADINGWVRDGDTWICDDHDTARHVA